MNIDPEFDQCTAMETTICILEEELEQANYHIDYLADRLQITDVWCVFYSDKYDEARENSNRWRDGMIAAGIMVVTEFLVFAILIVTGVLRLGGC